jgi:hypothetical protein
MPITSRIECGGGGGGITNPLADNESLVLGTTAPFSFTAQVAGLDNPYAVYTSSTDFPLTIFTTEENRSIDVIGETVPPGEVGGPLYIYAEASGDLNKLAITGWQTQQIANDEILAFGTIGSGGSGIAGGYAPGGPGVTVFLQGGDGTGSGVGGHSLISSGNAEGSNLPGSIYFGLGINDNSGVGFFEMSNPGDFRWKLTDSNRSFKIFSGDDITKYLGINVSSTMLNNSTTITETTGQLAFRSVVQGVGDSPVSTFSFSPTTVPLSAPTNFFQITPPQYSGLDTTNDIIDVSIGSAATVNFVGGGVGTAASLIAVDILGRPYSADTVESWNGDICTLRLGAPSLANVFPVNFAWSLIATGDVKLLADLYMMSGTIGIGGLSDPHVSVLSAAQGGDVALSQPDSNGLILSGSSDGTEAQMRLLGNIGWVDDVETAYAQFSSDTTNNLVIFGGRVGTEDHLDRTMIYSQNLQIVNDSVDSTPAPTVQFEIVNQVNSVIPFSIRAASGQTPSTFQITSDSGGQYTAFDANGRLNVFMPMSITGASITSVGVFGGDISTAWSAAGGGNETDGGSALWLNSKWESGTPFPQSVYAGYSASIRNDNTTGALEFYTHSLATNPDENVIGLKSLSISQPARLALGETHLQTHRLVSERQKLQLRLTVRVTSSILNQRCSQMPLGIISL